MFAGRGESLVWNSPWVTQLSSRGRDAKRIAASVVFGGRASGGGVSRLSRRRRSPADAPLVANNSFSLCLLPSCSTNGGAQMAVYFFFSFHSVKKLKSREENYNFQWNQLPSHLFFFYYFILFLFDMHTFTFPNEECH